MGRTTISFDEETEKKLDALAKDLGATKAEIVGRALTLYDYTSKATKDPKTKLKLSLTDDTDRVVKDLVFR